MGKIYFIVSREVKNESTKEIRKIEVLFIWPQHADMTVTSEEKVLNAILVWSMQADDICGWIQIDELLSSSAPVQLFGERISLLDDLLPFVRFPLMPSTLLDKVCSFLFTNF
jgi:hypothetical protein